MSQVYTAIPGASVTKATSWILTSSGNAVDTQTVTIGGVVLTSVASLSLIPVFGEVLNGANGAAFLTNLTNAINTPEVATSTFSGLSLEDSYKIRTLLALEASTTATAMTLTSSNKSEFAVSETETNFAWTREYVSAAIPCYDIGKTSIQFVASSVTSGNGVFTVEVTNDNQNWVPYNRLTTNVTNTNAQTDTRVASVTLNSNTSSIVTFPNSDVFAAFRVKVIPTTDGVYSAFAYVS